MMTKYEFRPDSSGAGERRGGSGIIRAYMALADRTTFTILADRERHAPWGLAGGRPGGTTEVVLRRERTSTRVPSKSTLMLEAGEVVEIRTAGGGGYGPPSKRRIASVNCDIENGLLSPGKARLDYPFQMAARRTSFPQKSVDAQER